MSESSLTQDYVSNLTIGKGKFYIKIGTVYIASMEDISAEKKANLERDYGITVVTEEEWEALHAPVAEDTDGEGE